ncbi:MAG: RidA family protein [Actinobacteria bacterium]|nr:RidA family protein [Actinomycetota bacterium]
MIRSHIPMPAADPPFPLSAAVVVGNMVLLSGCVPMDERGQIVAGSMTAQAELVFENMRRTLEAAGCALSDVVKINAFLTSFDHAAEYNDVYRRVFAPPFPARTTVQAGLQGFDIEVEAVACLPAPASA